MTHSTTPVSTRASLLFACIVIFALGQFQRAAGGVFGPLLSEQMAMPATALGVLVGAMFAATLAVQAPAGMALDRYGPRAVLLWALGLMAVGSGLFALAPSLGAQAWTALVIARLCVGAGLAATGAGVQIALAQIVPPEDYGYASGLLVTLGGVGGLLGTWPLAFALDQLPWIWVFGAVACAVVAAMALVRASLPKATGPSMASKDPSPGFAMLLKRRDVHGILLLGSVTFAPIVTITGLWGGSYLQDVHHLSPQSAGLALMGLFAMTIAAGYAYGRVDRIAGWRERVIVVSSAGSALCFATLALLPEPPALAAIGLLGGAMFLQQFYIPLGALLRDLVPPAVFGRANALLMTVSIGAIPLMQLGFGLILDAALDAGATQAVAYRIAFGILALVLVLALISGAAKLRRHG